jgi:ligand-binding sensor domain-containing protein
MIKKDQHVISSNGSWAVRRTGAERATRLFATQGEAVNYARSIAQREHTALYVHKKDGKVMSKDSYAKPAASSKDNN